MGKEIRVPEKVIYVCNGSSCKKRGSKALRKFLKKKINKKKIKENKVEGVEIIKTGCTDRCKLGPIFCIQPKNVWSDHVDEKKLIEIFNHEIKQSFDDFKSSND